MEANTAAAFAEACVDLYQNESRWVKARDAASVLMKTHYDAKIIKPGLSLLLKQLQEKKKAGELPRWNSRVLRHELSNSHKYFSKWIEEKEKLRS